MTFEFEGLRKGGIRNKSLNVRCKGHFKLCQEINFGNDRELCFCPRVVTLKLQNIKRHIVIPQTQVNETIKLFVCNICTCMYFRG